MPKGTRPAQVQLDKFFPHVMRRFRQTGALGSESKFHVFIDLPAQ